MKNRDHIYKALSQVRICRLPPWVMLPFWWKMRTVMNQLKNQLSDLYFFNYEKIEITKKKKSCPKMFKITGNMGINFFCATFSFWEMVDFVNGRFRCMWPHAFKRFLRNMPLTLISEARVLYRIFTLVLIFSLKFVLPNLLERRPARIGNMSHLQF